ncbi:4-hydroxyphenylacetate decarboxylase activase [Crassaminicella indica]|uniref:4-hydroxyphenylacetate decarboxylase activase n=1 Tax=Crassaminicella indica TaxID=2855394 RepID=A0ABX8RCV9_9CLOT|nr:4-hydroxyphenylacetate decarboxylase activase [Crassaminicella indica]QXM06899.1 4-hydroxyphenylacetate decarboxylase activase [Crassaminicella indica]
MKEKKGLLFDIQSYSVHDGPGCRTICFFSGCPLQCEWCANPEGWTYKEKLMFAQSKCKHSKGCTRCITACPHGAIQFDNGKIFIDRNFCSSCKTFDCTKVCYHEALKVCGKWYTPAELMKILARDRQYWGKNGGVTFSGGEPFMQKDFLLEMLKLCKEKYIHKAIETTAYTNSHDFLQIMDYIDFAFIDIKHMDREKHKEKTGVYNDLILKNIEQLAHSSWKGRLVLRMPVIRSFNDTDENIHKLIKFMKRLELFEINILPFHRLGDSKWNQLGKVYPYKDEAPTPAEKLNAIQDLFLNNDIACYIAHDTSF